MKNKIISILLTMVVFLTGLTSVKAAFSCSPTSTSIKVYSKGRLSYGSKYFPAKYLEDGTLAYCVQFQDDFPTGITMKNPKQTDTVLAYILEYGYKGKISSYGNSTEMKKYYYTQMAINAHLGQVKLNTSYSMDKKAQDLITKAENAAKNDALTNTLSISGKTMDRSKDGKNFISKEITIKLNNSNATVSAKLSGGTGASIVDANGKKVTSVKNGSKIYVTMPYANVSAGKTVTLKLTTTATVKTPIAYKYYPSASHYQNIVPGVVCKKTQTKEASISITATKAQEKIETQVKIAKLDSETKAFVSGATLVVKDSTGKAVATFTSTTTAKVIKNLPAGKYTLTETKAPSGYDVNSTPVAFTVPNSNQVVNVTFYNKKTVTKTYKVRIVKLDKDTNEAVSGATLTVKNSDGVVVATFDTNGSAKVLSGLVAGTYTVVETKAPNGYVLDGTPVSFTVGKTDDVVEVKVYNKKAQEKTYQAKVLKLDSETKQPVAGATLVLKDSKGAVLATIDTNESAKVISGLPAGTYTVTETKAPEGYKLNSTPVSFTVGKDDTPVEVIVYNAKEEVKTYQLKITKLDSESKQPVSGAELVLKDSKGTEVARFTTNENTKVISGLPAGTYYLSEVTAPDGYMLSTDVMEIKIGDSDEVVAVEFYNNKSVDVPITATSVSYLVYGIAVIGAAFGAYKVYTTVKAN